MKILSLISACLLVATATTPPAMASGVCNAIVSGVSIQSFVEVEKAAFADKLHARFPEFGFRPAHAADVAEIQPFINEIRGTFIDMGENLNAVFDEDLIQFDRNFSHPLSALFVITNTQGKIVGTGGFAQTAVGEVELRKIYIDPKLHGNGLGRAWVQSIVQLAQDLGHHRMWLINHHDLPRATAVYRNLGFKDFVPTAEEIHDLSTNDYWFLDLDLTGWNTKL